MDLKTYFTAHDGKVSRHGQRMAAVATACNVTPYYLFMVVQGHKNVSPELATALQAATSGACSRRELCPTFPWDEPKPMLASAPERARA